MAALWLGDRMGGGIFFPSMIMIQARWSSASGSGRISGVRAVVFDENHFLNFESQIVRFFLEFC